MMLRPKLKTSPTGAEPSLLKHLRTPTHFTFALRFGCVPVLTYDQTAKVRYSPKPCGNAN